MAYTLKDGYCEIINVAPEDRTGEAKAGEALKQGMVVVKSDSSGEASVAKASGTGNYDVYIVKKYTQDEVSALYNGYSEPSISSGDRVVTIKRGVVATDQYVGDIDDYEIGDKLEVGSSGNAGLVTNYNATPVGNPIATVYGKDNDKLIINLL